MPIVSLSLCLVFDFMDKENYLSTAHGRETRFTEKEILIGSGMYLALVLQKRKIGVLMMSERVDKSRCAFSKKSFLFMCKIIERNHGDVESAISSMMLMSKKIATCKSHVDFLRVCKERLGKLIRCK